MTNHHLKSAFELACMISLETDPEKKRHLVRAWHEAFNRYFEATAYAKAAHV